MKRLYAFLIAAALCLPSFGAFAWWHSIQQVGVVSVSTTTTWNPADKNANINLSSGNLVATATAGGNFWSLRAIASHSTGKYYWEVVAGNFTTTGAMIVGIANASFSLTSGNYVGFDINSVGWVQSNTTLILNNGAPPGGSFAGGANYVSGDIVGIALDLANNKIWMRVNGGGWMGDTIINQNPAINLGGADISAATGPFLPAGTVFDNGSTLTANFGATAYAFTPPAGFVNW